MLKKRTILLEFGSRNEKINRKKNLKSRQRGFERVAQATRKAVELETDAARKYFFRIRKNKKTLLVRISVKFKGGF